MAEDVRNDSQTLDVEQFAAMVLDGHQTLPGSLRQDELVQVARVIHRHRREVFIEFIARQIALAIASNRQSKKE